MEFPKSLQALIAEFKKLPGVGEKSARRYAFHVLESGGKSMAEAIEAVDTRLRRCDRCGGLSEGPLCNICADERRDHSSICVVENFKDVYRIEETKQFNGVYHVLGGLVSPIEGIGPEALRIGELVERVKAGGITEVVLATGSSVEGDATCLYIAKLLKPFGVKLTRLAAGLPVGGEIESTDPNTLSRAVAGRTAFSAPDDER
jgi:recombination protein RecR